MLVLAGWIIPSAAAEVKPHETNQLIQEAIADKETKKNRETNQTTQTKSGRILFEAGIETTYDSNVFYFSRDEMDDFDTGGNTNGKFTNINSIDDVILSPRFELAYKDLFRGHTLKSGIVVTPNFYTHNKIKDYEDYEFYVRQYLNKDEFLEFDYARTPEYMEGNFYDRDDARYKKATYSEDRFTFAYNRPLGQTTSAMAQYFYVTDDYNNNFDEYDMDSQALRLTLRKAFTEDFTGRIFGEYANENAQGDMGDTARVESDPSRQIWKVNLRGTYDVTSNLQMYLQYGIWFIDYTTSHSVADDPYHAERDDVSQSIDCHINYDLTKNAEMFLAYRYTIKDANPASDDLSILDAAILGYERHQVSFGVKYSF